MGIQSELFFSNGIPHHHHHHHFIRIEGKFHLK